MARSAALLPPRQQRQFPALPIPFPSVPLRVLISKRFHAQNRTRGSVPSLGFYDVGLTLKLNSCSTVGAALAKELCCPFHDGDDHHPNGNIGKVQSVPLVSDSKVLLPLGFLVGSTRHR